MAKGIDINEQIKLRKKAYTLKHKKIKLESFADLESITMEIGELTSQIGESKRMEIDSQVYSLLLEIADPYVQLEELTIQAERMWNNIGNELEGLGVDIWGSAEYTIMREKIDEADAAMGSAEQFLKDYKLI